MPEHPSRFQREWWEETRTRRILRPSIRSTLWSAVSTSVIPLNAYWCSWEYSNVQRLIFVFRAQWHKLTFNLIAVDEIMRKVLRCTYMWGRQRSESLCGLTPTHPSKQEKVPLKCVSYRLGTFLLPAMIRTTKIRLSSSEVLFFFSKSAHLKWWLWWN